MNRLPTVLYVLLVVLVVLGILWFLGVRMDLDAESLTNNPYLSTFSQLDHVSRS
jgi:Tfp pilus assembly protein PilX